VKICDRSGKEVWDSGRVEGKSGRNSIAWGGLRRVDFQTDIYYNIGIERKENKESGKGRQTVKYKETINESRDGYDLRYTEEGKPVLYSEIKTGDISLPIAKAEEKLKGVEGDVVETRIDDIQIKYSSIKPQSLLSGNYTVEVRVKDPESKEVKSPLNATVTIDLEKSFLIIVDDNDIKGISERNEFYPKEISSSSVKRFSEVVVPFRITADANVTVQIVSRKGGIEREINMGRILSGNAEARWDGMNKDAGFVPEGQYEMKILATDTTVLKNQKTIEYSLPVYVRKIPRVLAVKYRGTDEFYAFNLEKDYRFISPIISTRDVFDRLTNELGPDEAKEGEISIDFEFSEPVVLSFAVMSEDRMNKTQKVFRKDEWADLKYSDEKNVYAWSWNGEKIDKNKMAPLYEKYGIAHDDTSAEFIEPGLYQLWLFALPKGRENGKILYGFMNELCGKKERTCEEMQKFIEDNVADKKIIFDKNTIKGLGILTEVGVRMEGVVHKGMGEFLNFIKRK